MPYVGLDASGKITGLFAAPQDDTMTFLPDTDPAVVSYLAPKAPLTLQIVSTGTPSISGTYATDQTTLDQISALALACAAGLGFPDGATTFAYPDASGVPHLFTPTSIQDLYKALRDFMYQTLAFQAGKLPTAPTQPVTIP